jgi:hypothetical protein
MPIESVIEDIRSKIKLFFLKIILLKQNNFKLLTSFFNKEYQNTTHIHAREDEARQGHSNLIGYEFDVLNFRPH